jgi:hypothetical protein
MALKRGARPPLLKFIIRFQIPPHRPACVPTPQEMKSKLPYAPCHFATVALQIPHQLEIANKFDFASK